MELNKKKKNKKKNKNKSKKRKRKLLKYKEIQQKIDTLILLIY